MAAHNWTGILRPGKTRPRGKEDMPLETEALALGIDLGGTKILSAVVSSQGRIVSQDESMTPAEKGPETVVGSILDSARRALARADADVSQLVAIGVGAAGISNPRTGILFLSPHLPGCRDVPLRDMVEKGLKRKTFLVNDANAAALGELYFGAARGARDFLYITISTGIGGGIVIDGKLYTGALGLAGEVGHMTIDDQGPACNCGNHGCWETLASGTALAREAQRRIEEGARTSILDYAQGNPRKITAQAVHAAALQGDTLAQELIARTGYYIGVGLANLINIFNPELVLIGGGLANIGDMLFEPAFQTAEKRAYKQSFQAARFVFAQLGRYSGVLGAAAYALREAGEKSF